LSDNFPIKGGVPAKLLALFRIPRSCREVLILECHRLNGPTIPHGILPGQSGPLFRSLGALGLRRATIGRQSTKIVSLRDILATLVLAQRIELFQAQPTVGAPDMAFI
jgi:hypothetical protein